MFDNINDAILYIESKRSKRTIEQFKKTLEKCNINVKQKNMIHIAGTNGKGSTVNYLRSVLNAHGYKVGTFTSPYLICHNDRIRIDDMPISDDELLKYINQYYDVIEEDGLSMFEIDVLIMLTYFEKEDLDYRIIETGIGGLRDKTNVIEPILCAITNVGMDHMELLGEDVYAITKEKMGIIKKDTMFVTSEEKGTLLALMQEKCDEMNAMMYVVPEYQVMSYPFKFDYRNMSFTLKNQGIYQVNNARLALTIASKMITLNPAITIKAIEEANWKGRFETLKYHDTYVDIDGAHNVPGIVALLSTIEVKKEENVAIIFSSLRDKATNEMIDLMLKAGHSIYLTSFEDDRSLDLSQYQTKENLIVVNNFKEALKAAYLKKQHIVVTGSLHFISLVRKYLTQEKQ